MDPCLALRIAAIFVLSSVSLLGIVTPLMVSKESREGEIFIVIKTGAAGVMLGLCLIHLMPDANEQLQEVFPDYPLAYALTCLGVVLVLAVEQITLAWAAQHRNAQMQGHGHHGHHEEEDFFPVSTSDKLGLLHEPLVSGHDHAHGHDHESACGGHDHDHNHSNNATASPANAHDHEHEHSHSLSRSFSSFRDEDSLRMRRSRSRSKSGFRGTVYLANGERQFSKIEVVDHDHGVQVLEDVMHAGSMRDLMTAYALEISTAIHSIIIGVDLGMLTDYNSVALLLAALCFHQFVEGLGLGTVIGGSSGALGNGKVQSFVIIFSSMVSFGVIIGILSSSDDESQLQKAITGSATSIAAGSLMYTALTEMAGGCFNSPDIEDRLGLKITMVLAFLCGVGAMALIGIWA